MESKYDVLSGYGYERYSDRTWPDDMVYRLDLGKRGGRVLTGHQKD